MANAVKLTQVREVQEEVVVLSLSKLEAKYLASLVWLSEPVGPKSAKLADVRDELLEAFEAVEADTHYFEVATQWGASSYSTFVKKAAR